LTNFVVLSVDRIIHGLKLGSFGIVNELHADVAGGGGVNGLSCMCTCVCVVLVVTRLAVIICALKIDVLLRHHSVNGVAI